MQIGEILLYDQAVEIAERFFNFRHMLVGCMKFAQPEENGYNESQHILQQQV